MKQTISKFLLALVAVGASCNAISQPLLLSNCFLQSNHSFSIVNADTTNISQGTSGPNQVFDFSNLQTNYTKTYKTYIPDTMFGHQYFPTSNVCIDKDGSFGFYQIKTDSLLFLGNSLPSSGSPYNSLHSKPHLQLTTELQYGQIIADTSFFEYYQNETRGSVDTLTYDAYGTLILPDATHQNVMRIKRYSLIYSINIPTYTFTFIDYEFYIAEYSYPLLTIHLSPNASTPAKKRIEYVSAPSGIASVFASTFTASPNPTTGLIHFQNKSGFEDISVYDLMGRVVWTGKPLRNQIDLSGLENGIYTLRTATGNAAKVVMQR